MTAPAWEYRGAPFNGPLDITSALIAGATGAGVEGIWIDSGFAKSLCIEVGGAMDTVGVDVYGSNASSPPPNEYAVTIGGSVTASDVLSLSFANGNLATSPRVVSYTTVGGDTPTTIAAALAAAVNTDTVLAGLGIAATSLTTVVTITYPSVPPAEPAGQPQFPGPSNATVLIGSKSEGASETIAVAAGTNGEKIGSTLAALGMTALTVNPRWVTARLTTLTGASANISVNAHGVG